MSEAMTINDIINQLGSLRASSAEFAKSDPENEIWKADVTACETSIRILAALSGEGCTDLETTLDFLQDYNSLAKQYQALHRKYETPGKPTHKDGVWHCPACNSASKSTTPTAAAAARRSGGVERVGAHLFRPLTA